jgi:very-short-patch-repair endonuclease
MICNLPHNKSGKTCSDACKSALLSQNSIARIKKNKRSNYRRDKQSWLESSFEQWLIEHDIRDYEPESTMHNHITKKWYFVDFYFPSKKLIIELDGKQHELPKHKSKDQERDLYIKEHLGIDVIRITHNEYINKTKYDLVYNLLVSHEGTAPSPTG